MAIVPHPPVLLSQIRVNDIWLLLAVGAVWELFCRTILFLVKRKPSAMLTKEHELSQLQAQVIEKRKLGPSAFVETSKLERQVLVLERDLGKVYSTRKMRSERLQSQLQYYGNMQLAALVFILYYGVPLLTLESGPVDRDSSIAGDYEEAAPFLKRMLFPISYVGLGVKIARWGMVAEQAETSIGALVVMWSAQATVGKLMDALDALYL